MRLSESKQSCHSNEPNKHIDLHYCDSPPPWPPRFLQPCPPWFLIVVFDILRPPQCRSECHGQFKTRGSIFRNFLGAINHQEAKIISSAVVCRTTYRTSWYKKMMYAHRFKIDGTASGLESKRRLIFNYNSPNNSLQRFEPFELTKLFNSAPLLVPLW